MVATEENIRFFQLIEELKSKGVISGYVHLAAILETNKAGISDLKSGRKKLSTEAIRRMKISYPKISIDWIIMGYGTMFCETETKADAPLAPTQQFLIEKIAQQAEEIGALKQQIKQSEEKKADLIGTKSTKSV